MQNPHIQIVIQNLKHRVIDASQENKENDIKKLARSWVLKKFLWKFSKNQAPWTMSNI
jgi:hypothetical protein